jgi:hypothetical protein
MTDEERDRIAREAKEDARWEARIEALEKSVSKLWYGIGAGAMMVFASIWDGLKGILFK